jgi:hypothetical protein
LSERRVHVVEFDFLVRVVYRQRLGKSGRGYRDCLNL